MTSVDSNAWPLYMKIRNMSHIPLSKSGHAILLVGFNETNKQSVSMMHTQVTKVLYLENTTGFQWMILKEL